jgi:hypothetical protein
MKALAGGSNQRMLNTWSTLIDTHSNGSHTNSQSSQRKRRFGRLAFKRGPARRQPVVMEFLLAGS